MALSVPELKRFDIVLRDGDAASSAIEPATFIHWGIFCALAMTLIPGAPSGSPFSGA
jgi:hypothetical protein